MNEHAPRHEEDYESNRQVVMNAETDIQYTSPSEQSSGEMPQHKFEVVDGDEIIGGAEIDYFSKPLPLYQVTDLWVDHAYAGRGNASRIMDRVEDFLEKRGKPGLLVNAIVGDSPAGGMYERRGWEPVPDNPSLHVYNWPQQVSLDVLKSYAMRQTPIDEREGMRDIAN